MSNNYKIAAHSKLNSKLKNISIDEEEQTFLVLYSKRYMATILTRCHIHISSK